MKKYTQLFVEESRSYLDAISEELGRRRRGCATPAGLANGSRLAHSIKGMALFEEQGGIASLAFALEQGLGRLALDGMGAGILDPLEEGVNLLRVMVDEVERQGSAVTDSSSVVRAIVEQLEPQCPPHRVV